MIAADKRVKDLIKQRLVGALILLALGVVFWPIIFTPPVKPELVEQVAVPAEPQIDTQALPRPTAKGLRVPQEVAYEEDELSESEQLILEDERVVLPSDEDAQVEPASQVESEPKAVEPPKSAAPQAPMRDRAPTKPTIDSQGLPVAWMLQIVSVSDENKAKTLREQLLSMGHKAYIKRVPIDGKTLHRIYIGPKFEKAEIERLKPQIDARFGVHSLVKRYLP